MEPMSGLEPETSSLPRPRSANLATWARPIAVSSEPTWRLERETGFEPATPSLEGWRSTAELFPLARQSRPLFFLSVPLFHAASTTQSVVGRGGLAPPKASASRFTVCPLWPLGYLPACSPNCSPLISLALAGGFEPPTHCLQGSCSTPELRQQSQNFTLSESLREVK